MAPNKMNAMSHVDWIAILSVVEMYPTSPSKVDAYWKLYSFEIEEKVVRDEWNSWNEHTIACATTSQNLLLHHFETGTDIKIWKPGSLGMVKEFKNSKG